MAHLQYMPGDPRLVDQLVYELKSKGIFDQFRKDCIADVDTRPAYQNLRQRVENSVSSFLSRQCWKPDLNKNQLREKLRKHILDGNYLEQGVERIVDQVVNPKVASVFIPQVEDLVYNYLGISRKKVPTAETSNGKIGTEDLLPTDLEAVSPGSVKSNEDKNEAMDEDVMEESKMEVDEKKDEIKIEEEKCLISEELDKPKEGEFLSQFTKTDSLIDLDKISLPTSTVDVKLENIPPPENSPPKIDLEKIELPKEPYMPSILSTSGIGPDDIPMPTQEKEHLFKPVVVHSDESSSSDSSLRRNMSPLTPIRNYNNENSCDAQQAFENDSDSKSNDKKEPNTFRFAIDAKSPDNNVEDNTTKKDNEQINLSYQFNNQVNINTFNTPLYDDSSNSNNLQIDYESDVNSKNIDKVPETENSEDKRDKKSDERKSSHKSSHKSRDSYRHSSSKDKRSDSKQSNSRDSSRHNKKPKDDHSKSNSTHREREKTKDQTEKKDSRDSSKHRSSSHKSSSNRDSKSHRSSSSSQRHSSDKKSSDDKRSSSSHKDKSDKSSDRSKDKRDSKSSSHRSDKDRKSNSKSKNDDKDKKKEKKDTDDHYSMSGRGNHTRRSTDRDSNDGNSSSSKGSQNHSATKSSENKKESKESNTKSDNTSTTGDSASPSDKEVLITNASDGKNQKPVRVENALEVPITSPPRLPFVPDVTLKKPKFAANLKEAKKMMRMRKFLDEEQKRMNQEAALLLEFQANVRPSLSQVYSSIPGPELEFACITNDTEVTENQVYNAESIVEEQQLQVETPTEINATVHKNVAKTNDTAIENEIQTVDENITEVSTDNPTFNDDTDDDTAHTRSYSENKPFSQLMDEITEYSKASEKKKDVVTDKELNDDENKKRTEYFEITVIAEELSESEDAMSEEITADIPNNKQNEPKDAIVPKINKAEDINVPKKEKTTDGNALKYFAEQEKFDAELKRHEYSTFLETFTNKSTKTNKIYLINCDTYEESIIKEVCETQGQFEIINYYKNGHSKLPKVAKNVVKNVNLASEIILPLEKSPFKCKSPSPVFSPVKSECSFELSSDYDAKLEEMVNKTSRQQVLEIILGSVIDTDDTPTIDYCTDNPTIDYCTELSIDTDANLKRKVVDNLESAENNNRQVLTKMRKLSFSDQISSTTEESEEISNNNRVPKPPRSKYLGRARRVGLARPRKTTNLPNSPSSDKSVENYEQNTPSQPPPNGKLKSTPRNKVQRYDTSDLYKPKLHYLSRRNNVS